jgi:hypothetical protein
MMDICRTLLITHLRHLQAICRTLDNRGKCRPVRHIFPISAWTRQFHEFSPNQSGRQRQADFAEQQLYAQRIIGKMEDADLQ